MGWYLSVDYMPVGDAVALSYSSPALIVPLCALVLGEPIAWYFPLLFALCFGGVLLIAQPAGWFGGAYGAEALSLEGVAFAAMGVVAIALVTLLTRMARRTHVLHVQQASGVAALVLVPLSFAVAAATPAGVPAPPPPAEWPAIAAVAVLAFVGMACWKLSNDFASTAAEVQLLFIVEVPIAMLAQAALFDDSLDLLDWLGTALILLSSVLDIVFGGECCRR
jgi:drug/metabolite transporter (DMT)-like permease